MSGIEPGLRPPFVIFMDALEFVMNYWSSIVGNLIGAVQYDPV